MEELLIALMIGIVCGVLLVLGRRHQSLTSIIVVEPEQAPPATGGTSCLPFVLIGMVVFLIMIRA